MTFLCRCAFKHLFIHSFTPISNGMDLERLGEYPSGAPELSVQPGPPFSPWPLYNAGPADSYVCCFGLVVSQK